MSLPIIKTEAFREPLKKKFNNYEEFNEVERNDIRRKYSFSNSERCSLNDKEKELKQLQQSNIQDTISLLIKNNKEISSFIDKINNANRCLKSYEEELFKALASLDSARSKNEEARQRSEILAQLPKTNMPEWKSFIRAGHDYSILLGSESLERCPYCRQELRTNDAIKIVKAYADYLSDDSEKELNNASEALDGIRQKIEKIEVAITPTEEIKRIIANTSVLESKLAQMSTNKKMLLSIKDTKEKRLQSIDFSNEVKILNNTYTENENSIKNLVKSNAEKDKKAEELQKEIALLKEWESISCQKSEIDNYFSIIDKINLTEKKRTGTKTNQLTALANQVQKDLLTDALKTNFEKELKALGRHNLQVQLMVTNGNKGKCNTQLILTGNNSVTDILSEGEQKAVGLAMFFAEIQDDNYPIILDDPVTSLDHEIAGKLAIRLLDFDNQVIVFCHNRLFLDGFETSKSNHVCKNFDSCCNNKGKHIFIYKIYGDGKEKGILSNYKSDNSDSIIKEVNYRLSKRPFDDSYGVSILLRRAVEKIIDEEVFKHLLPPRVSNKNSRIDWDELKKINSKPDLIDRLRVVHDLSSEEDHVGTASTENPISIDKLRELSAELVQIKTAFNS